MDRLGGNIGKLIPQVVTPCGFDPHPLYQTCELKTRRFLYFQGADTSISEVHHCLENQDIQMLRFKVRNKDSWG
jgi:hypothetical protein